MNDHHPTLTPTRITAEMHTNPITMPNSVSMRLLVRQRIKYVTLKYAAPQPMTAQNTVGGHAIGDDFMMFSFLPLGYIGINADGNRISVHKVNMDAKISSLIVGVVNGIRIGADDEPTKAEYP